MNWDPAIVSSVHQLPEGDAFARLADEASASLPQTARKTLHEWRGKDDSLRLHQATYIGLRLQKLGVHHLHVHFAGMAARTAFWIRRFFGIEYSLTVHANDIFVPNKFEIGLPQIFSMASAIVVVSDFAANQLRDRFSDTASRFYRIYNGIDCDRFRSAQPSQPPLILSIGRLISKKGFDVLIDACASLQNGGQEFRCEIIGEGPLSAELQARIDRHGLGKQVLLVGPKSQAEIAARLSRATLLVLPCRVDADGAMDNLPTVVMEAMASALPVVSTDVGGVAEMVCNGESGLLVSQNDPLATAEAIARLIGDVELARSFGREGRKRAEELFSIEKNVRVLREILLRPRRPQE
ncbi:MAG TPA: glycosyltransferase family 4 protein [Chthoniobacterales bacterium]|nr:glycosyltransferase family 4 protein [Chthoniobacterales bacterium]